MPDLDPKIILATQRSHEDAKSANSLLQAAGQAAILINGGASTAILTFTASEKAGTIIATHSLPRALLCFAVGVIAGACVIGFQAVSAQRYTVRWQNIVLGRSELRILEASRKGYFWGALAQSSFLLSILAFMIGIIIISYSFK